jgi:hypothetical protein
MFAKKKTVFAEVKAPEEEFERDVEEDPEIKALQERLNKLNNLGKTNAQVQPQVQRQAPVQQMQQAPVQRAMPIQYQEPVNLATIVSAKLLSEGTIETVVISNSPIGEVGQTFEA